ncbi:hypothetical protein [Corynebacterium doosanense]|uniref:Uncharacterized protein n=1 Tax=Corynebacterium doosanense CAU 212 = DSM 45436 TaxID=558173 RepID=A0A097IHC5_9CORY|nr:hypothetical protein [Corynebacterium doosanense]AIT61542.1 hypothetical protein CDOO_09875 [Corynebacterium doosanense CAU 212 = DSM 45436]
MTTTLSHAPARTWRARHTPPATRTAVLSVSGMPRELRSHVERAMESCLRSEPAQVPPGTDLVAADWFTRWERDRTEELFYAVRCRQVLTGTVAELEKLDHTLQSLADDHGFQATIRRQ